MTNLGIIGYGNLGRGVRTAISKNRDMALAAVFTRRPDQIKREIIDVPVFDSTERDVAAGMQIDVMICKLRP